MSYNVKKPSVADPSACREREKAKAVRQNHCKKSGVLRVHVDAQGHVLVVGHGLSLLVVNMRDGREPFVVRSRHTLSRTLGRIQNIAVENVQSSVSDDLLRALPDNAEGDE